MIKCFFMRGCKQPHNNRCTPKIIKGLDCDITDYTDTIKEERENK